MAQIQIDQLQYVVDGNTLFTTDRLTAHTGDRVGIVGANGAGKTTLGRIVAGATNDFTGKLQVHGAVTLVPQVAPTHAKSGGQSVVARVREAMAANPEVLILDEPSANLDEQHQEWLKQIIAGYKGLLLLISHDRTLLKAVATKIWAVRDHRFTEFGGSYDEYVADYVARQAAAAITYRHEQQAIRDLELAARKRREKAAHVRKGSKSMSPRELKTSKEKRELNAGKLERSAHAMLERAVRDNQAEKPTHAGFIKVVGADLPPIAGKSVLRVAHFNLVRAGRELLHDVNFTIAPGDCVSLTGANGSGKTTLLTAIMARKSGIALGPSVRIGYFAQDMYTLDGSRTVEQTVAAATSLDMNRSRRLVGAFGLNARFYPRLVSALSGGEQVKLQLLTVLLGAHNFLILDEPTNYLDLPAIEALTKFLQGYPGTVLFVAHDQEFRQQVATRTLAIAHRQLREPARVAQGVLPSDLPALQFKYDQMMLAEAADPDVLRDLRQQIAELKQ